MRLAVFTIEVRELRFTRGAWRHQRIGQIDTYLSVDVIARYNDTGSWRLRVQEGTLQSRLLQPGRGVIIWLEGMSRPLMSGPIRAIERWFDDTNTGPGSLDVHGPCDTVLLADHICLPESPNPVGDDYRMKAYDGNNEPFSIERLIRMLPAWNFGHLNRAGRTVPGTRFPEPGEVVPPDTWPKTTYRLRFETILEALKTRAETPVDQDGKVVPHGFQMAWEPETEQIAMRVYRPSAATAKAHRFSAELGNLRRFHYVLKAPIANWLLLGLDSEDETKPETRNLWAHDNRNTEPEWQVSAEKFLDHSDVSLWKRDENGDITIGPGGKPILDTETITNTVNQDLTELTAQAALSLEPMDTEASKFGVNYFLGDLVTVVVDGKEITDVLREVHLTDDENGPQIIPQIGSGDASETPALYQEVRKIWQALRSLQRHR